MRSITLALVLATLLTACTETPGDPRGDADGQLTVHSPATVVVGADDDGGTLVVRAAVVDDARPRVTYTIDDGPARAYDGAFDAHDGSFTLTIAPLPAGTRRIAVRLHRDDGAPLVSVPLTVHVVPRLREIAMPAGAGDAFPTAINARGDVTGWWTEPGGRWHAFLLRDGRVADLATAGEWRSAAAGLSPSGDVVGYVVASVNGEPRPVRWRGGVAESLLDRAGTATAVNDAGVIGGSIPGDDGVPRAFALRNGTLTVVGEPGRLSGVRDVNAAGAMVGASYGREGDVHGFVYANGALTTLPSLGGVRTFAEAINDAGTIVGYSADAEGRAFHAFVHRDGRMERLAGMSASVVSSFANDVESSGAIVGELAELRDGEATSRGFLHVAGRTLLLDDLLGLADYTVVSAKGITDRGEIAAAAVRRDDPAQRIRPVLLAIPGGLEALRAP